MKLLKNTKIRIALISILIFLFAYQNVDRHLRQMEEYRQKNLETVTLIARAYGYEGEEESDPILEFIDKQPTRNFTYDQEDKIDLAHYFHEVSKEKIILKRGGILISVLIIPYLLLEYIVGKSGFLF
ncbi:hypothetical protein [Facklamia sp. 7083-14-GEN3]|uniref:hypothetical protein n=1 Tax=Facklamia sp. 7083-14-GEN3 TaxID=2973478 RepID=UPI00215D205E|nr:hypothetical protein [Facklamia sp. 7083-14-GEN3]MCR8969208.1 hypothetical protein [Facklamia sp. 7083-14-GEN3]